MWRNANLSYMLRSLRMALMLQGAPLDDDWYYTPVTCQLASLRGEHHTHRRRALYVYVCLWNFRLFSNLSLRTSAFSQNPKTTSTWKAAQNLSSRFELDPSAVARVEGAWSFFFSGVDTTISRVSLHDACFCTYVPVFFLFLLPSNEHTAQDTHHMYT